MAECFILLQHMLLACGMCNFKKSYLDYSIYNCVLSI